MNYLVVKEEGRFVSCGKCRTRHVANDMRTYNAALQIHCNCGEVITSKNTEEIYPGGKIKSLIHSIVYEKGDKVHLLSKTKTTTYYQKTDSIVVDLIQHMIVFNRKTGFSYRLPDINERTGKKTGGIRNITYQQYIDILISDESKAKLKELFAPNFEGEIDHIDSMFINRFNMTWKQYEEAIFLYGLLYGGDKDIKDIKDVRLNIRNRFIPAATTKELKVAKKFTRDYIGTLNIMAWYKELIKLFKDNNCLLNMLKIIIEKKVKFFYLANDLVGTQFLTDFLSKYKESVLVSKLTDTKDNHEYLSCVSDTTYIYDRILSKIVSLFGALDVPEWYKKEYGKNIFAGNFIEIHDRLYKVYEKLNNIPVTIEYSDKERELEYSNGIFNISLAIDTGVLKDIGTKMHICVGSYDYKSINKIATILYIHKDGEYKCCIELDRNLKVVQAKLACNQRAINNEEIFDFIVNWANEKKLKIDTYDLTSKEVWEVF